jgi:cytochrome b
MSIRPDPDESGGMGLAPTAGQPPGQPAMVQVWDPVVRSFHWILVVLFAAAYVSAEEAEGLHLATGYGIVALLVVRVVWGFIGSPHARFTDFVRRPRAVLDYLRLARAHRAPRYLGHNPAGGAMTIALMAMIAGICLTGHLMTTAARWGSAAMEGLHELLVNGTIGLIGLHLLGNLFSSLQHRENLTLSMITGMKRAVNSADTARVLQSNR